MGEQSPSQRKQPSLIGDTWFNTKPLLPGDLAGKAVLVDFWTYSCVNCIRTLPFLRKWWEKYKDKDFLIIGIHTPEFEFEKDPKNVEQAIRDLNIEWPVVLDNEYKNWNNFDNHSWPAKYLVDQEGNIVYSHFGEGAYEETEKVIRDLIQKKFGKIPLPPVEQDYSRWRVCFIPTPEIYCGYKRGDIANFGSYHYDKVGEYKAPDTIREDSIALSGKFIAKPEYVESVEPGATIFLRFRATEVNIVLHPVERSITLKVAFNQKPLPQEIRGSAVNEADEVRVEKPAMYNLLKSMYAVQGIIEVTAKEGNFRAYAFTFSGCSER